MDRKECEFLIAEKLREIRNIYKQYRGETYELYLSMLIYNNCLSANNLYFGGKDIDKPINYFEDF